MSVSRHYKPDFLTVPYKPSLDLLKLFFDNIDGGFLGPGEGSLGPNNIFCIYGRIDTSDKLVNQVY